VKSETRKALVGGVAHLQHALRLGDLPFGATGELLKHVNVALEGRLTEPDLGLVGTALDAVERANKAHRRALNEGERELARSMEKALTVTPADLRAAGYRARHGAGRGKSHAGNSKKEKRA
jgi:hypothetical protein